MMFIIKAISHHGDVATCNEECYDAQGGNCSCICGGRNHGIGLRQALLAAQENVPAIAAELKDRYPLVHTRTQSR